MTFLRTSIKLVLSKSNIHTSSICATKAWRRQNGLPLNKTSYGPLTDLPDYTFLDGRPTPIGSRQKNRLIKNEKLAQRIVDLTFQMDYAKDRHQQLLVEAEERKKSIMDKKLKDKGQLLLKKS